MIDAWLNSPSPSEVLTRGAERAVLMYLDEACTRARILHRLAFSQAEATVRIQGGMESAYALLPRPSFLDQIPAVVEDVYHRGR